MRTRSAKCTPPIKSHMVSSLRPPIPVSALHALSCILPAARCQVSPPIFCRIVERHPLSCNRTVLCKGVLRARSISQDMLPCCDYSSCPCNGSDGKPNGGNVRMDCEQLFLFRLSIFFPCHCELRGHSTALPRFRFSGDVSLFMLSDLLPETVLKQGPGKEERR